MSNPKTLHHKYFNKVIKINVAKNNKSKELNAKNLSDEPLLLLFFLLYRKIKGQDDFFKKKIYSFNKRELRCHQPTL